MMFSKTPKFVQVTRKKFDEIALIASRIVTRKEGGKTITEYMSGNRLLGYAKGNQHFAAL